MSTIEGLASKHLLSDSEINDIAKKKSIEFAKRLNHEGYREYDEDDRWIQLGQSRKVFTTKQLYELFYTI